MDIQASIAQQLTARLKTEATQEERLLVESVQPSLKVQPFYVADGGLMTSRSRSRACST